MCEGTVCTRFYSQVLVYGVGIPLIFVILSSLGAPKTYEEVRQKNKEQAGYGSCQIMESSITDPVY